MSGARPFACVLGDTDLLRPLGLAGIPCAVVAPPGAAPRYSRFARMVLDWADAWDEPGVLLEVLERFGAAQPEPPVLFYEEDRDLLLVSRCRDRLRAHFRFVVPDAALVEDLVDKGRFQMLAQRLDLPVPAARVVDPLAQSPPLDLRYPLVLKPLVRRVDRWTPIAGGAKALQLATPATLAALWPHLTAASLPVLLQETIAGPESRVESYHVYVDERGDTVAEFTGRKIRTWPLGCGDSTALVISDAPDVAALGRGVIARLGLRGVAKLDFKRAPDGRLYLLEINPRFTLWHHLGARAGVNVPALVYGDLVGLRRPHVPRARAGVRWCKPWHDLPAARASGMPALAWVRWMLACEAKRAVAWDDPFPLIGAVLWRAARRLLRSVRRAQTVPQRAVPAALGRP